MINILINAYACAPNMGSEPGMAWNWCIHLAKYCNLYIITEGEFKEQIEENLKNNIYKDNLHFYFLPVSEKVRKMCWNQGDWRFYYYYKRWQKRALALARELISKYDINVVHQLNMIGFREPGYLWKIRMKSFVWGPVDAKEGIKWPFLDGMPINGKLRVLMKNILTVLQLKYSIRVRKAINRSSALISASSDSLHSFQKYYEKKTILINETGCSWDNIKPIYSKYDANTTLKLLWIGKFDFRKQLKLALHVIHQVKHLDVTLDIVGGEPTEEIRKLVSSLDINEQVNWLGIIPHEKVQTMMRNHDLFFFTSIAEGTPHVVLEAINNDLPVLCFDTCGQGDVVNERIGIKVKLSDPRTAIKDFSQAIEKMFFNRKWLHNLSINCNQEKGMHAWDKKAKDMFSVYKNVLNNTNQFNAIEK